MVVSKIMDANPTPDIFHNPSVSVAAQRADLEHSADSQALVRVAKAIESVLKDGEVVLEFASTTAPGFPTLLAVTNKRLLLGVGEGKLEEVPLDEVTSVRLIETPEPSVQLGIYNASTTITGFGKQGIARVGHALEWVLRSFVQAQVTVEPKDSPEGLYNTWANARNDDTQPADLSRKHWYATIAGGQVRNQPLIYTPAPASSHGVDPINTNPLLAPPPPSSFKEFVKPGQTAKPTVPVDLSKPAKATKEPKATRQLRANKNATETFATAPAVPTSPVAAAANPSQPAPMPAEPTNTAAATPDITNQATQPAGKKTSPPPLIAPVPSTATQSKNRKKMNRKILVGATSAVAVTCLVLGGVWIVNSFTGKQAISSPTSTSASQQSSAAKKPVTTTAQAAENLPAGMAEIAPTGLPVKASSCTKDNSYGLVFEMEGEFQSTVCEATTSDYQLSKVYYLDDALAVERLWVGTYAMVPLPIEAEVQPGHELVGYATDGDIAYIADVQGPDRALVYEFTASTDEQRMNFLRDFKLIL